MRLYREFLLGASPLPPLYNSVSSVMFGQNMVAIRKQTSAETRLFNRRYRLELLTNVCKDFNITISLLKVPYQCFYNNRPFH